MSINNFAQKAVSATAGHSIWQLAAWLENRQLTKTANVYYKEFNITVEQAKRLAVLTVVDGAIDPSIFNSANFFDHLRGYTQGTEKHEAKFEVCLKSALSFSKFTSGSKTEVKKEKITF